ncbi:hypothetical protein [Mesorhizobium onobrychidis]|uniref:Cytochrome c domain-containing protein n=1 Tax=Mesorhizobium onobrychidis TaxID=2775404 RepID=A0ABY5R8B6_9HYPH|nr:hypothetical protein [Mesorhizobium onobrychidis]UVC19429.1 hypothetical protein IHQ72_35885 [Mesorhizobium onobrychidis]
MTFARAISVLALLVSSVVPFAAGAGPSDYPAASVAPKLQSGWDAEPNQLDVSAPPDEAQGGITEAGTPINPRTEDFFPAEQRNLFWEVDQVVGPDGGLHPFPYSDGSKVPPEARDAIRGKNTWITWGEGNEVFWDWVQQHGYGLADFLILMDSRQRGTRFAKSGLINQPGMQAQLEKDKKILGLYLDEAVAGQVELKQPDTETDKDIDAETGKPAVRRALPDQAPKELFEPGDRPLYTEVRSKLARDGLDPSIYGYPSGIVGLRLFLNPNFFGNTKAAEGARGYWKTRVQDTNDAYYTDQAINADPKLVRPFRVSMACGFCHIAPHPLNPPADPEKPGWANLSSTIGDQYWDPVATFVNLKTPSSFLYQFLASQQPGTIDTSLVSTDHINNSNTITAVFDVPARLERAKTNLPEKQNSSNLLIPYAEEPKKQDANPRLTPRVLLDGADSVGVFGALSRVYLNIGAYSEEWKRLHNTVVGFTPQRPFAVSTALKNSVYWKTADKYRIPYLAAFFTYKNPQTGEHVTQPMHLATTAVGKPIIEAESEAAGKGRAVFIQNCAICHSSKQPDGFSLTFSRDWASKQKLAAGAPPALTLPMDFADWTQFTAGDAYREYVKQIEKDAEDKLAPFLKDNFLSNEIRVPITLVGTNSARAAGTNAMRGQIWDNFSSEDYKNLPAVGEVHFFNPFSGAKVDEWGNNDTYAPPGGGPGYYRPASLISLWATAPYLHNNALGQYMFKNARGEYTHDPSIEGRLKAFEDGIDKILWKEKRESIEHRRPGDLRGSATPADSDEGFIYRTTQASYLDFPAPFIRQLIEGVAGPFLTSVLTTWLWVGIALVALVLAVVARPRHAGFVFLLIAVLAAVALRLTRIDTIYPLLWLIPAVAVAATALLWFRSWPRDSWAGRVVFLAMSAVSIVVMIVATTFVNGGMGGLKVGPIPAGTPVNLIMNINPEAPIGDLMNAAFGMTRGILRVRKDSLHLKPGDEAWQAFKDEAAGPLMRAIKNPDFVLDRGHWFAEKLTDEQKKDLKAFLKTL